MVGLDAGCGKGRYTRFLAEHLGALVALDGSSAVEAAARNLAGFPSVLVVRSDLRQAPFAAGSFDFISSLGVLHHLDDPRAGFDRLVGIPGPGGPAPPLPVQPPTRPRPPLGRLGRGRRPAQGDRAPPLPGPEGGERTHCRVALLRRGRARRRTATGGDPSSCRPCPWTPTGASRCAAWSSTPSTASAPRSSTVTCGRNWRRGSPRPGWRSSRHGTRPGGSYWPDGAEHRGGSRGGGRGSAHHGGDPHPQRPRIPGPLPGGHRRPDRATRRRPRRGQRQQSGRCAACRRPRSHPDTAGPVRDQHRPGRWLRPGPGRVRRVRLPPRVGARRRHGARSRPVSSNCGPLPAGIRRGRSCSPSPNKPTGPWESGHRGAASSSPGRSSRRSACRWRSCSGGPRTPSTSSGGSPRPDSHVTSPTRRWCTTMPSARGGASRCGSTTTSPGTCSTSICT